MKKKILTFILTICLIFPCVFMFSACDKEPETPPNSPSGSSVVYTVTEAEWEINFNITKLQSEPQAEPVCYAVSNVADSSLDEITSYTLRAEGESEGEPGLGILKVAQNGLYMEFYVNNVLSEDETGTFTSSNPIYIGMTKMLGSYLPFSGQYDRFTFDQTKNAYVAQNLKSTVINEEDINETRDLFNKYVEITFINGYLNTVSIQLCMDESYVDPYLTLTFTFSDINNTIVDTTVEGVDSKTEL